MSKKEPLYPHVPKSRQRAVPRKGLRVLVIKGTELTTEQAKRKYAPYSKEGWEDHLRQLERTLEQIRSGSITLKSAYISNPNYGGYTFTEAVTRPGVALISGAVDYADPGEVLLIAKTGRLEEVSLAGDWWPQAGFKGWGQKIPIDQAKVLLPEWRAIFLGSLPTRTAT